MKIYTRTGDQGETGLFGGARVRKNDPRVEAYGTIDELNASLGVVLSAGLHASLRPALLRIQSELFTLGAEVACVPDKLDRLKMRVLDDQEIARLELEIDGFEEHLPPLTQFILPNGSMAGAGLHLSRTIARRAERRALEVDELRPAAIKYLNRLSDYLFVMARRESQLNDAVETPWEAPRLDSNAPR